MSKKCPNCLEVYDDNHGFCSNCGSRLVDDVELDPILNLGDANAISGGVNINRSKNITSHDTHYHSTTVHERAKSDSELKLEAMNQLRCKAEEIIAERGRIDSVAMGQLRPFAAQLGIEDETFKSIIKDVRSNRNGSSSGLSAANARYLLQAQQAVQTNDMDSLSNLTPRLEAMAAISLDDNVQYLYYLTLSLLYPLKSMEVYEHQTDENYWRSFWAIISYIRTGKHDEAIKVLALFEPLRFEKSEEDQNLLEAYFNLMKEDKDGAQEFLDEILGEPSEQLKPLLRAIEISLYEEEADSLEVRFYHERVLSKSEVVIKTAKKVETSNVADDLVPSSANEENNSNTNTATCTKKGQPSIEKSPQAETLYAEACAASGPKRVMLLQKAADAGSLDAMYELSDCYCDGEGVGKNMDLAISWLTKAADLGLMKAQTTLGMLYMSGFEGHEQNYAISEKYLTMAAERGFPKAQVALSYLYIGMEEYGKALMWSRKAAELENEAYSVLGQIYLEGLGVDKNEKEGLKYYEKAANGGDADAQNIVGNLFSNKNFGWYNLDNAFKYYQMAAAQNHLYGMFNYGLCYVTGDGCNIDILQANEWIGKAAEAGCVEAQEWLANNEGINEESTDDTYDWTGMTPDDEINYANEALTNNDESKAKESVAILKKYANLDEPRAQFNLALCYHFGYGIKQNYQVAASWFNKSAKLGFAPSMYQLGEKYEEGHGCTVDMTEAAKWYRKAANLGMPEAQFRLGLCYINGTGVVGNRQKGIDFIKKAAEQNLTGAQTWIQNEMPGTENKPAKAKSSQKARKDDSTVNTVGAFEFKNINFTTDGRKEIYIDVKWDGNQNLTDCLEIDLLGTNREFLDNKLWPEKKCRFVLKDFQLKLRTGEVNKLTFYVEMYDRTYKEDESGEYSKNKLLVAKGPINVNVYYEFHIFGKNVIEIRK